MATKTPTKAELETMLEEMRAENAALKENQTSTTSEDTEKLKSENAELASQLQQMQMQLAMLMQNFQFASTEKKNQTPVTFTCAYDACGLRGQSQTYELSQFQSRSFNRIEAFYVAQSVKAAIIDGGIFVDDQDFIDENNLYDETRYVIPLETLKNIKSLPADEVLELYKKTTRTQQDIIKSTFYADYLNGRNPNFNVLHSLGIDVSD